MSAGTTEERLADFRTRLLDAREALRSVQLDIRARMEEIQSAEAAAGGLRAVGSSVEEYFLMMARDRVLRAETAAGESIEWLNKVQP